MTSFVKRRERPEPGSIPDVLGIFSAEVRFYREVAPHVGVRVPTCYEASEGPDGTLLVLEDLSAWSPGADPVEATRLYAELHARFAGVAEHRWPWLRRVGLGADLVGELYDRTWPVVAARSDVPPSVRHFGDSIVGHAADAERAHVAHGPLTLIHGDATARNQRTSPDGEIALLDWEDAGLANGVADIAWLLISSVSPERWRDVLDAYPDVGGLSTVLPAAMVQGVLSVIDSEEGSEEAAGWMARLEAGSGHL